MSKKILITIGALVVLLFITLAVLAFLKSKDNTNTTVVNPTYQIEITYQDGLLKGLTQVNDKWVDLTEQDLQNYVTTSFNSPKDVLWVLCRQNYKVKSASSETDADPFIDDQLGASITVYPNQLNSLTLTCEPK